MTTSSLENVFLVKWFKINFGFIEKDFTVKLNLKHKYLDKV